MPDYTTEQLSFLQSSGKVVLHACPGSGKTTVVAKKMIDCLQHWDRSHQGIAVLSFTNVASDEINRQAAEMLSDGFSIDAPHFVGTLDSFIDNFIFLQFGYLLLESPKRPVITSTDIVNAYSYWRAECFRNCLSNISDFRWDSNGCLTKNGSNITCTGAGRYDPPCIQFKKRMLKKGLFFQDEIAGLSCILLEKFHEVAKSIASRFPVIILDEAQDTSKEQMRIIDLLCAAGLESVYIIGDPDQSIYEWRNANPESFLEKMRDSEWTQLSLSKNFRSSQLICNATYVFSDIYKDKTANDAAGACAAYNKKPTLFLYGNNTTEESIIQKFIEECVACNITLSPNTVAIVKRGRIHADDCVENLWKTPETELLARASFEWMSGNRRKAYSYCEKALFQMTVKDSKDIDISIENEISNIMPYDQWKQFVIEILINLPAASEQCGQWVTSCRAIMNEIFAANHIALLNGVSINNAINIKSRDSHNLEFKKVPIKSYFEAKTQAEYTHSSVHGVKGETFDALLLYIHGTRGNTLTPAFLASGSTDTELMRIAYVAMTRPRKLLVIAMPKNKANLSVRFPKDVWDYVEI
jgi:superfamily I DNA/RNA helicase